MSNDIPEISKTSLDAHAELMANLKAVYPGLFDGDGNLVKPELEKLATNFAATDEREKYEFNWTGKTASKRIAYTPSKATLRPNPGRSVDFDHTGNAIIEGDNLEVLKLLQKSYSKQIKCIYIDPPYNTGNDFVYRDNYAATREAYWQDAGYKTSEGVRLDSNSEANGRYHSDWLSMMQSRLLLARTLLKDDGVIFVSIDDHEAHNLRKLTDEIFGPENFVGQIVWKNVTDNNPTNVALEHEYIICYAKDRRSLSPIWKSSESESKEVLLDIGQKLINRLGHDQNALQSEYSLWFNENKKYLGKLDRYRYIDEGGVYTGSQSVHNPGKEGYRYDIIHPKTGKPCKQPLMGYRFPEETINQLIADGKVIFGDDESKIIELKVYAKDYVDKLPSVIELDGRLGSYDTKQLFQDDSKIFNNPKPVGLIKRLLSFAGSDGDTIIDFFAGSGTTAQSVMALNAEDGGSRKFILVQVPEATDEKSEARRAGYKTISQICIERVKRAGAKNAKEGVDTGFKVFELSSSNFPENNFIPDADKTPAENTKSFDLYVQQASQTSLFDANQSDLLAEIALKDGFTLNHTTTEQKGFTHNRVLRLDDGAKSALICIDSSIDPVTIEQLREHPDTRFICLEAALDTSKKWTLKQILGSNLWVA